MSQDYVWRELLEIRKDLRTIKGGQTESTLLSIMSFIFSIGFGGFMFSVGLLYKSMDVTIYDWMAWIGIFAGVGIMLFALGLTAATSRRKARGR